MAVINMKRENNIVPNFFYNDIQSLRKKGVILCSYHILWWEENMNYKTWPREVTKYFCEM